MNPNSLFTLKTLLAVAAAFAIFVPSAHGSGTSVGDGGDPVFYFLESTRSSLKRTLAQMETLAERRSRPCETLDRLTVPQKEICREFTLEILPQILKLNGPMDPTPFVLRSSPLYVDGPDGQPMPVAARTIVGPGGPIEFHRSSIEFSSPTQLLFLMAHEFGHKAAYKGGWLRDNEMVEGFGSGRALLDAFAESLVEYAKEEGLIGTLFGLRDVFECRISTAGGSFNLRVSTPRRFVGKRHDLYRVSLGVLPTDPQIEVPEADGNHLQLRLQIEEDGGCNTSGARHTSLQIQRVFPATETETTPPQILTERSIANFNPVCVRNSSWMTISFNQTDFACRYVSTEGVNLKFMPFKMKTK